MKQATFTLIKVKSCNAFLLMF